MPLSGSNTPVCALIILSSPEFGDIFFYHTATMLSSAIQSFDLRVTINLHDIFGVEFKAMKLF